MLQENFKIYRISSNFQIRWIMQITFEILREGNRFPQDLFDNTSKFE